MPQPRGRAGTAGPPLSCTPTAATTGGVSMAKSREAWRRCSGAGLRRSRPGLCRMAACGICSLASCIAIITRACCHTNGGCFECRVSTNNGRLQVGGPASRAAAVGGDVATAGGVQRVRQRLPRRPGGVGILVQSSVRWKTAQSPARPLKSHSPEPPVVAYVLNSVLGARPAPCLTCLVGTCMPFDDCRPISAPPGALPGEFRGGEFCAAAGGHAAARQGAPRGPPAAHARLVSRLRKVIPA